MYLYPSMSNISFYCIIASTIYKEFKRKTGIRIIYLVIRKKMTTRSRPLLILILLFGLVSFQQFLLVFLGNS